MSFILEALKKADAERDRGAVPDLHAQAMLPQAAFEGDSGVRARPWRWLVAGAAVAMVAVVLWQWLGSEPPAAETLAAPAPPSAASAAAPAWAAASMPATAAGLPPVAGAGPGFAASGAPIDAAPAADTPKPAAVARTGGVKAKPDATPGSEPGAAAATARKPGPAPDAGSAKAAVAKAEGRSTPTPPSQRADKDAAKDATRKPQSPAASEHLPLLAELPDDVRRQVPALKLGGLVYSAAPASRMLLVNGDVQREGATVAPGLTLERINPKSAVFSLRGQRFEVPM